MDQDICSRCNQAVTIHEKEQHADWHLATDLQSEETSGESTLHISQKQPQRAEGKQQQSDGDSDQPPSYAPPAYPPPTSRAGGTVSRPHTNQVIEAAELRAKDEVRIASGPCIVVLQAESWIATNAKRITELAVQIRHIQQRDCTRA